MDSKFTSSFMPKADMDSGSEEKKSFSIFSGLAVLLFILSMLSTGGLFAYKRMVRNDVDNLKLQLASAEQSIDRKTIDEIKAVDWKLKSITEVLNNHVTISKYFEMLQNSTVRDVRFDNLRYLANPGGDIEVVMGGRTKSFATIALQEDVLLRDPNSISIDFGNLRSDKQDGSVTFSLKGKFKNNIIKFTIPEENTASSSIEVSDIEEDMSLPELPNLDDI